MTGHSAVLYLPNILIFQMSLVCQKVFNFQRIFQFILMGAHISFHPFAIKKSIGFLIIKGRDIKPHLFFKNRIKQP